jgi:predicted dehydrogenase
MLRYGVIGIKGIGQYHIKWALRHPNVRLTALVDTDADAVHEAAIAHGTWAFTDYQTMLAAEIVDAVSIALPHHLLATVGLLCLRHGLHILVEKPFALTASLAAEMLHEARTRSLQIGAVYQYRTHATMQMLERLISEGVVGRVRQVLWVRQSFRSNEYYRQSAWRSMWRGAGGGLLMNQISHDIDLLCWLFGKPLTVTAMLGNQLHDTPLDDVLGAVIAFENGVLVTLHASLNHPHIGDVCQIIGDQGMIVLPNAQPLAHDPDDRLAVGRYEYPLTEAVDSIYDPHYQPTLTWRHIQTRSRWQRVAGRVRELISPDKSAVPSTGHGAVLFQFVDAVLNGSTPMVSGAEALQTLECINALIMAAVTGKTIHLPFDHAAYDAVFKKLSEGEEHILRWR